MSGDCLDYVIVNKTKIVPQTGSIESIVQKKSNGFTMEHTSKF